MDAFDFFSTSPEFSIFQNRINRTKFGGTLFVLYLIVMLFISLIYILDFYLKEEYEIECNTHYIFADSDTNDKELNTIPAPLVNFTIKATFFDLSEKWEVFKERIFLRLNFDEDFKPNSHKPLDRPNSEMFLFDFYEKNISKVDYIEFIYKCKEINCTDLLNINPGGILFETNEFDIDNYAKIPFQIKDRKIVRALTLLSKNNTKIMELFWESISYEEKKGISKLFDQILNIKNTFIYGYIIDRNIYENPIQYREDKNEIVFATIQNKLNNYYIKYKRTKNNFLDVLAKIGALFSTFNFIVSTFFKFYKKNFDNYKIVEKNEIKLYKNG